MIKRLLVANRGEIACRIMRTARAMGIECAAVCSDADLNALHAQLADVAFPIGPASSRDSYLNQQRLIEVASAWGADAIHPGYGFLSENSTFARAVTDAGMIFVGPSAQAIEDMGNKSRAKALMAKAGVPLLPGYHGDDQDRGTLRQEADGIGYPLLIKAVAGGGGRGLRVVHNAGSFDQALDAVVREAGAAFGDERVLLEAWLPQARHVEVQVFADSQGNTVHLFERDCSIQRRHQKIIEEAPAPGITEALRAAMGAAAVKAAAAINYTGAGTVEFLLQGEQFHFMEMNTRLQVEHPVTELLTGLDLVEWQLLVASGAALPLGQSEITRQGCAMEVRINAENASRDFMPATGLIKSLHWPVGEHVRIDSGFRAGDRVSMHYDSLLAKLIVHGANRAAVVQLLLDALDGTELTGVETNINFLAAVLSHPDFQSARLSTRFLETHKEDLASLLQLHQARRQRSGTAQQATPPSQWQSLHAWRSLAQNSYSRRYHLHGETSPVAQAFTGAEASGLGNALLSPLPGRVLAVHVEDGDTVTAGQALLTLEAMKMEHTITASSAGRVNEVLCRAAQLVQPDQALISFHEEAPA